MLKMVHIKDFAIIENLQLQLNPGMTVITGETGAGKSILLDALDIALGDKATTDLIRPGSATCEIALLFEVDSIPAARAYLEEHSILDGDDCLVRRVLTQNGRTRNFVNGSPVTAGQLQALGKRLLLTHSQHQHHALLHATRQREALDNYANQITLLQSVRQAYLAYQAAEKKHVQAVEMLQQFEQQAPFLSAQHAELEALNWQADEWETLQHDHRHLATASQRLEDCRQALALLEQEVPIGIRQLIQQAQQLLAPYQSNEKALQTGVDFLEQVHIYWEEACDVLQRYLQDLDLSPERLQTIEERISEIHHCARKYRIKPEEIPITQQTITARLNEYQALLQNIDILAKEKKMQEANYQALAAKLSVKRKKAAAEMSQHITQQIKQLNMPDGEFIVQISEGGPSAYGIDEVSFLVQTNAGQMAKSLAKVVSGGELSRISLAIQLLIAECGKMPTLIFDEVDVGIGGQTAVLVGDLLKRLAKNTQVLCVTHLAAVAAAGEHHLKISKQTQGIETSSQLHYLSREMRVQEIARMLSGAAFTEQALAHAAEILALPQEA